MSSLTEPRSPATGRWAHVAGPLDDIADVLALTSGGRFTDYLTYHRAGTRWFAGNPAVSVVLDRTHIRWTSGGHTESVRIGQQPLRQLGDVVSAMLPAGRRAFGYLTFGLAQLIDGQPPTTGDRPLANFFVPDVEVVWRPDGATVSAGTGAELDEIVAMVGTRRRPTVPAPSELAVTSIDGRQNYEAAVRAVIDDIRSGLLRKAIVSRRVDVPFPVDLPASYAVGLGQNTPARSFLLRLGGRGCAGFSPETLVEVGRDGEIVTQPLAGTRPLSHRSVDDRLLREELRWDVKECYEHIISVRLAYEELSSVCLPASVSVRDLLHVRERGTVQHLGSTVGGQLRPDRDLWDGLAALFPAVTASGIPKRAALHEIADLEQDDRELYAGAICVVDANGELDSALVLRSIFQSDGGTWLRAGAGIVTDSDPRAEYDETTNKLLSAARCLVAADDLQGSERS